MSSLSKPAALAGGLIVAFAVAAVAQAQKPSSGASKSSDKSMILSGVIDWVEKSDVSALTEGILESMEMSEGMEVVKDGTIGQLHTEKAKLGTAKARLASKNVGALRKAEAQTEQAYADVARLRRLNKDGKRYASEAEVQKAEAELKVAEALVIEAKENHEIALAELELYKLIEKEHTILSPFDGLVIKRLKHPGESVRANEPVVKLGKIDRLRFYGFVTLEQALHLKPGMIVDVRPTVNGADLPIEHKRFRGKIKAIGTEVNIIGKTEIEIYAEINNNKQKELRPGLESEMTVYLDDNSIPPAPTDMLPIPEREAKDATKVGSRYVLPPASR